MLKLVTHSLHMRISASRSVPVRMLEFQKKHHLSHVRIDLLGLAAAMNIIHVQAARELSSLVVEELGLANIPFDSHVCQNARQVRNPKLCRYASPWQQLLHSP